VGGDLDQPQLVQEECEEDEVDGHKGGTGAGVECIRVVVGEEKAVAEENSRFEGAEGCRSQETAPKR
jgi:hypothetical protein